jgi:hypothetical protein
MRALDPSRREVWRAEMAQLRDRRELFSYRFPLSGPNFIGLDEFDPSKATHLTRLIAELAALNTECFEAVLKKYIGGDMPVVALQDHDWAMAYDIAGETEIDRDDQYRFSKLRRGWGTVSPLEIMISDGLMDVVYGSWCNPYREDESEGFDPDSCSDLILRL